MMEIILLLILLKLMLYLKLLIIELNLVSINIVIGIIYYNSIINGFILIYCLLINN